MEHNIERLMGLHEEAWEELMGAKHYLEKSHMATSQNCKEMYKGMASDEVGHADHLMHEADSMLKDHPDTDPLVMVWHHLKARLHHQRAKIEAEMKA